MTMRSPEKASRQRRVTPRSRSAWRNWLQKHHANAEEIWVVFYKKNTGHPTLSYNDLRRGGPVLRLDRRHQETCRRRSLHASVHTAKVEQRMVRVQQGTGPPPHRGRTDDTRRTTADRPCETERRVEPSLDPRAGARHAGRTGGRTGRGSERPRSLQRSGPVLSPTVHYLGYCRKAPTYPSETRGEKR